MKEIGVFPSEGSLRAGAKAQNISFRYAALKGRSSTVVRSFEVVLVLSSCAERDRYLPDKSRI